MECILGGVGDEVDRVSVFCACSGEEDEVAVDGILGGVGFDGRRLPDSEEGADAWVIGDNLEWEIAAPGKLGFTCVWVDKKGSGLPLESDARPDAVIDRFPEVLDLIASAETEG